MASCAACGRWKGSVGEQCPHCGWVPRGNEREGHLAQDLVQALEFEEQDGPDDLPRTDSEMMRVTPTVEEIQHWYPHLNRSPVFAGTDDGAPVVAPLEDPEDPGADAPPVLAPVLEPRDPAPRADLHVELSARYELPSVPQDADPLVSVLLRVDPEGEPLRDPALGPVAHVVLALDLSASMNKPDKYPVLTRAIENMLYELHGTGKPEVLLSVVAFAHGAEILFRDLPASGLDPREVLAMVDRSTLRFGRYTDVGGALSRAGRVAYDSIRRDKSLPVRVYVLTDGKPQDMQRAREKMAVLSRLPVDVDALCFGHDADVAAMQELCSGGRGGTVKQVRSDNLEEAFGRIAEVAQRVVATRALLDLELRPGVVAATAFRYRPARHRYDDERLQNARTFSTDLGTLESGRRYALLFQFRLPGTTATETEVGRITLRLPAVGGPRLFECLLSVPRHPGEELPEADAEVQAARDVLTALAGDDPAAQLRALRIRRDLYLAERRDPHVVEVIERAIAELEERGNLAALSASDQAALLSHTCTAGGARPSALPKHAN